MDLTPDLQLSARITAAHRAAAIRYPSDAEIAAIKAGGRITEAAKWDNMTAEQRAVARPDFNPKKRWFEQKQNAPVKYA